MGKSSIALALWLVVTSTLTGDTENQTAHPNHGLVGLRPLPRSAAMDHGVNHGGSWMGTPTFAEQKGNYPFVAEHVDVIKGWLDGDFQTKRVFFEHYWGLSEARDDLEPKKNLLNATGLPMSAISSTVTGHWKPDGVNRKR